MSRSAVCCALVLTAGCSPKFSGRLNSGFGPTSDGVDGTLSVSSAGQVVNVCEPISSTDGDRIAVGGVTAFTAGRRILLLQTQEAVGDELLSVAGSIVDPIHAGRWELARVSAVETGELVLDAPARIAFSGGPGRTAQACTLPEFSRVAVSGSASLVAVAWDGSAGGVLAFLAEELVLAGEIQADGLGFRGGDMDDFSTSCPTEDDLEPTDLSDSAGKGEGIDARGFGRVGRAAISSGGGGGNTCNGGGGGGGGAGHGGKGGRFESALQTGGVGGSAVGDAETRLLLGGGGGCGHCDETACADLGRGGAGGGAVFVSVNRLSGSGRIGVDGAPGGFSEFNGGGGGGAGGTVLLWAVSAGAWNGDVTANGGAGGTTNSEGDTNHPPGAGGGGGRILLGGVSLGSVSSAGGAGGVSGGASTPEFEPPSDGAPGSALRFDP